MDITGDKVLLVGNWGHKNMGDELILVGNIKILLNKNKKLFIACSNKEWIKNFHKQFFKKYNLNENEKGFTNNNGEQIITYIQELPKGFRSTIKLLKNIKDLKKFFEIDSILIGGGEIFTEETPGSYWYWLASVWPLIFTKKLYLSGGIQIPKKLWNKIAFSILSKKAKKIYLRDFEFKQWKGKLKEKSSFFPDTSIFVYNDINLENYKWNINFKNKKEFIETDNNGYLQKIEKEKESTPYIIININKRAEKFYKQIEEQVDNYYRKNYDIYFVPVCKSPKDQDIKYYHKLKEKYYNIKLLDWEKWDFFIEKLALSEKVYTTRLHLFLVSYYLNCNIEAFEYQKKVLKMKEVLNVKVNKGNISYT